MRTWKKLDSCQRERCQTISIVIPNCSFLGKTCFKCWMQTLEWKLRNIHSQARFTGLAADITIEKFQQSSGHISGNLSTTRQHTEFGALELCTAWIRPRRCSR